MIQGTLNKIKTIPNENDNTDMMCITFSSLRKLFFVGHKSGVLAAYLPDGQTILKLAGLLKIHDGVKNFKITILF
jgi:hypothetical protein